jgi:hypothetical protein
MATKNKKTTVVKKVKTNGVRVRSMSDIPHYFAKKSVTPFNELTEQEKVDGGYYPPLQRKPNFQKDQSEKDKLHGRRDEAGRLITRGVHTGRKGPTGSVNITRRHREPVATLIVHLANPKKSNMFKTTYSFQVKPSEVNDVVNGFNGNQVVTKYHYMGVTKVVNG